MMPGDSVYTVSQVTQYLKETLDVNPLLSDLWVAGEVSNLRRADSGHCYFTLRDREGALRCVMFRSGRGASVLSDGGQIVAHGRVSIYPARGDLQFYADLVRPDGVGPLQQAFEALKQRLQLEGLFEPSRKRPLPAFPERIAVITSPGGAALQDVLKILSRRYPLGEVLLIPTLVQGDSAAPEIVQALQALNALPDIDVAILTRGGGSMEDLWPFNEEAVARAIFASTVPTISAVGHETDVTIADLVADYRAPTPSAAAEIVAPDRRDLLARTEEYAGDLQACLLRLLRDRRAEIELAADHLYSAAPDTRIPRTRIDDLLRSAGNAMQRRVELHKERVRSLDMQLGALGPGKILERGYALVRKGQDGPLVTGPAGTAPGDLLLISFAAGEVEAETLSTRDAASDGRLSRAAGRD